MDTYFRLLPKIPLRCREEDKCTNGIALLGDIDGKLFAMCEVCDLKTLLKDSAVGTWIVTQDLFLFLT